MSTTPSSEETTVICPYCDKAIEKVLLHRRDVEKHMGWVGVGYPSYLCVVTCPHCKKVLTAAPV